MKRFLMRFFPIRAASMEAFIDLVKLEGCRAIQIVPVERDLGMPGPTGCSLFILVSAGVEHFGIERYLRYSARTGQGREIRYFGNRTVMYDEAGISGGASRERESLMLFIEEERQAQFLRSQLHGVVVEELNQLGMLVTSATRRDIHQCAAERGITPP